MEISNKPKKGRKNTEPLLKQRTLVWYWGVRYKTGLKDGELDLEFGSGEFGDTRKYVDRIRIFEDIRTSGCTITRGTHLKRKFDLLASVEAKKGLVGSVSFYDADFWNYAIEKQPTIESAILQMVNMIKKMNVYDNPMRIFSLATSEEIKQLAEITDLSERFFSDNQAYEIHTNGRESYDNLLNSLSGMNDYVDLLRELDFNLLTRYLNNLTFFIAFYRYAFMTKNFHALISASSIIDEYLFILFAKKEWDFANITKVLGYEIYKKIYSLPTQVHSTKRKLFEQENFNKNDANLAVNTLIQFLK